MAKDNRRLLNFQSRADWRHWLARNHEKEDEAWLVLPKKGSSVAGLALDEAVQEALCFGWIDGLLKGVDETCYSLRFTPRRPNSVWSIHNIRRVETLIAEGLMTEAGLAKIQEGKRSGQWQAAIQREQADSLPDDLDRALRQTQGALASFRALPASRKQQLLHWIGSAVRPATRQKRIAFVVDELTT